MKLRAIRVSDVKGFGPEGSAIEGLGDGLNVLAAENEFGKSTLFEALRVVLYEKHTLKNAKTKALRPYHGKGGPTVEVDFETDAGLFRLHKRFLSRATASVINLETGQAIASGDDVQDWMFEVLGARDARDGPTGLLWVAQGQSLNQPEATETSGALLSGLIEQTVREVTGGARVRDVLTRAEAALATLVTAGRGQPTQRYSAALKTRADLLAKIADFERRLDQAETTRAELTRLQAELATVEDPAQLTNQQQALKVATEKLAGVQQLSTRREGLNREIKLTADAASRIERDLTELETAQSAAGIKRATAKEILHKITQQERVHKNTEEKHNSAIAAEDKQKHATGKAKAEAERARKAAKARDALARLKVATQDLQRAEVVASTLAQATKTRDAISVDRQALERLDDLRTIADRAEARHQAGQTKVSVSYVRDAQHKVRIDGQVLGDQEQRPVEGRLVLDVETVGQLVVDAGDGGDGADAEQQARITQQALSTALQEFGVTSLAEARELSVQKTQAEAEARGLEAERQRLAPEGIEKLKAVCATLAGLVVPGSEKEDPTLAEDEAERQARAAEGALEACHRARTEAEQELIASARVLSGYRSEHDRLVHDLDQLHTRFGPEENWEVKLKELQAARDAHKAQIVTKTKEKDALEKQLVGADGLAAEKNRLEAEIGQRAKRGSELKHQTGALMGALGEMDKDGVGERHAEATGALERANAQIVALESEKRALETLIETLKRVESNAQEQFFAPVMEELRPLLHQVMPDSEIKLSANFSPDHIVREGLEEPFTHLSGGTREQIAVLTRLAFARLMARKGWRMPVILDDALVYSDDARIEQMFKALQIAANDIQLIVLTCRQKTFQDLGGTTLKLVGWQQS